MGYEFFCGIPVALGAGLALTLGLFIALDGLEDWAAKLINKLWWDWRNKGHDTSPLEQQP